MKRLKRLIRRLRVPIIICSVYAAAWFALAWKINTVVATWPASLSPYGIAIDGRITQVRGFPLQPYITFSGKITGPDGTVDIPAAELTGFPLPKLPLTLMLPQGAKVEGEDGLWAADFIYLKAIVPWPLPQEFTTPGLTAWRDHGGTINITALAIRQGKLEIGGVGRLGLDDNLQPAGAMNASVTGYDAFIDDLGTRGKLKRNKVAMGHAVLGMLAGNHPGSISGVLLLKKQTMSVGPLPVLKLPEIKWPAR